MSVLKVQTPPSNDIGTQRCRLSVDLLSGIGASIGQYVSITCTHSVRFTCKLFSHVDLDDGRVNIDPTVCFSDSYRNIAEVSLVDLEIEDPSNFSLLTVSLTNRAVVNIVSKNFPSIFDADELTKAVKAILMDYVVMPNVSIDCSSNNLARCMNINLIYINKIDSNNVGSTSSAAFKITSSSEIFIEKIHSDEFCRQMSRDAKMIWGYDDLYTRFERIVGYSHKYRKTCQTLGMNASYGVLLTGPAGVGKTTFVRSFCRASEGFLIEVSGTSILEQDPGESEKVLRDLFRKAESYSSHYLCMLFFDEIEIFCSTRKNSQNHSSRIVTQLLTLLDGIKPRGQVVVVGVTNNPNVIDPALRRPGRFDTEINMNIPNHTQRLQILRKFAETSKCEEDVDVINLANVTRGYTGADLELLWRNALFEAVNSAKQTRSKISISNENILASLKSKPSFQQTSTFIVDTLPVEWNDVIGLSNVKLKLKQVTEWPILYSKTYDRLALRKPRGILLFGPPGCCKTTLVKAVATSNNISFIAASVAHIYSPFVGDSEKCLSQAFDQARLCSPCILFLDELDSMVGCRDGSGVQKRILSTLLNEMDGIGIDVQASYHKCCEGDETGAVDAMKKLVDNNDVIVVAATNRPDMIDEALLRPGRFDHMIYVPPPDQHDREEIFARFLKNVPKDVIDVGKLAASTEHFSGADLYGLCQEASLHAMVKYGIDKAVLNQETFDETLKNIRSSIDDAQIKFFRDFNDKHKFTI